MEVKTRPVSEGTEITVETESKVAVVVETGDGERIYLPSGEKENSSYYSADPGTLTVTESGYSVVHQDDVQEIQVISNEG